MSSIFISHSSVDNAVAAEVRQWLLAQGHRLLFLDFDPEFGIPAGRDWQRELYQQLRACRAVIVLCSQASMASRWCFAEISHAREMGKALLPLRLDDCPVDSLLAPEQAIDFQHDRAGAFERLRRGLSAAGVDPTNEFDWDSSRSPYPGLLAFQERDAAVFFGRGDETLRGLDLLNHVRRMGSPSLVVVLGSSGSGKSSLVRAGLVPRLRRDPERWIVVDPWRPGDDPVAEFATVWSRAFAGAGEPRDRAELVAMLHHSVAGPLSGSAASATGILAGPAPSPDEPVGGSPQRETSSAPLDPPPPRPLVTLANELRRAAGRSEATVLTVVDQFEELLGASSADADAVLMMLRDAAEASASRLVTLATLRSDFLGPFQTHAALAGLSYELLPVGPMDPEDVSEIIEGPARVSGLELEPGLVPAILADADVDDALPLLAFAMHELYDHGGADGLLEVAEYRQLGTLHQALGRTADELLALQHLDTEQEDQLRRAFLAMAHLAEDERWVRRVARWDDLPRAIHPVLETFVTHRLLVSGGSREVRTVEVAHEAMFRSWERLAGWLEQNVEAMRLRRNLHTGADAWNAAGRQAADLWRGARLTRAAELADSGDLIVESIDKEFVDVALQAEQAERNREHRARRRKLRIAAAVTAGALVLAAIATVSLLRAQRESEEAANARQLAEDNAAQADENAQRAEQNAQRAQQEAQVNASRALAGQAQRVGAGNPALGLAVAAEAMEATSAPRPEAISAMFVASGQYTNAAGQQVGPPLQSDTERVSTLDFNPRGDLLATAGSTKVQLWDANTGDLKRTFDLGVSVEALAFHPTEEALVAVGVDGTALIWDIATGAVLGSHQFDGSQPIHHAAFGPEGLTIFNGPVSPDGRWQAVDKFDGTINLWNRDSNELVRTLDGHDSTVITMEFSPDSRRLVSTASDGTVRVWDTETGDLVHELEGHEGSVRAVAFSPDGELLATAGEDEVVRIWAVATGEQIGEPLEGHNRGVSALAFGTSGLLASVGDDGTVRVWEVRSPGYSDLETNRSPVHGLAFSVDRQLLASTADSVVHLWNVATGEQIRTLEGAIGPVHEAVFTRDGQVVAAADDAVHVWDASTGDPVATLDEHLSAVSAVALSPDESIVAAGAVDGTVHLWDRASTTIRHTLDEHTGEVTAVTFSADGQFVATASYDSTVRLWDPMTGGLLRTIDSYHGVVAAVAFSPDAGFLAATGDDGRVVLSDPATGESVRILEGHDATVTALAFSPVGDLLATASADGTIGLWDPATGQLAATLNQGHSGAVTALAFSADGRLLATTDEEGAIRLWDSSVDAACRIAGRYVIAAQVEPYLPPDHEGTVCNLADELRVT